MMVWEKEVSDRQGRAEAPRDHAQHFRMQTPSAIGKGERNLRAITHSILIPFACEHHQIVNSPPFSTSMSSCTATPDMQLNPVLAAFWRRISELTTRTRNHSGHWVGSPEVKAWNSANRRKCDKCCVSRSLRECLVEEDQASCKPCRAAHTACDRKLQFLFESTREEFFPTMEKFLVVFKARDSELSRSYQKTANKRRKASLPCSRMLKSKVIPGPASAVFIPSLRSCEPSLYPSAAGRSPPIARAREGARD
ncbi:hypothetical protein C8F04DRAFT_1174207 [Mycena alexandri]|uniref:Uncharacterized protein n=1 Tax=Mycena alexandri TaxID=1745969 RepID=A0AAD6TJ77_9AGAR|nr:hypothetical protein C8F04DRAFT_1174207 [Mycena alexandri]